MILFVSDKNSRYSDGTHNQHDRLYNLDGAATEEYKFVDKGRQRNIGNEDRRWIGTFYYSRWFGLLGEKLLVEKIKDKDVY